MGMIQVPSGGKNRARTARDKEGVLGSMTPDGQEGDWYPHRKVKEVKDGEGWRSSHQQPVQSLMTSFKVTSELLRVAQAGHSELERNARRSENTKCNVWLFGNGNECKDPWPSPLRDTKRGDEETPQKTWCPQKRIRSRLSPGATKNVL